MNGKNSISWQAGNIFRTTQRAYAEKKISVRRNNGPEEI